MMYEELKGKVAGEPVLLSVMLELSTVMPVVAVTEWELIVSPDASQSELPESLVSAAQSNL